MDNYKEPTAGKTYVSPSLSHFSDPNRKIRIASKVVETAEIYEFAKVLDEIVLRRGTTGKTHVSAKFFEVGREMFVLTLQRFTTATDAPHTLSFSFMDKEIETLYEFLQNIQDVQFKSGHAVDIKDKELRRLTLSKRQAIGLLADNQELFAELVASKITTRDVTAIAYRKQQLEIFRRMLAEPTFFLEEQNRAGFGKEALWQAFFERNPWIFGYGLSYIYLDKLDKRKLEQVVQGYSVGSYGKRVDGLMKTKGVIASLCFVEIKHHQTSLLDSRPYRTGCWPASSNLAGAISQMQGTVAAAMDTVRGSFSIHDDDMNPTGEDTFNYAPKAFVVIGTLDEFMTDKGVNKDKFRSFELLRRNCHSPEIITFDELYDRARYIVDHST